MPCMNLAVQNTVCEREDHGPMMPFLEENTGNGIVPVSDEVIEEREE